MFVSLSLCVVCMCILKSLCDVCIDINAFDVPVAVLEVGVYLAVPE